MRLDALIADRGDGIGLWPAVRAIFGDARDALQDLPLWERGFYVFWLSGPFILLVERTPADIWLSLIALSFAVKSIVKRDGAWLRPFWVRAGFVFWAWCLISAALSSNPGYSLGEAAAWGRRAARGGPWGPKDGNGRLSAARCGREASNSAPAKKAPAAAARRPSWCARQPFLKRSDGVEARATMLS